MPSFTSTSPLPPKRSERLRRILIQHFPVFFSHFVEPVYRSMVFFMEEREKFSIRLRNRAIGMSLAGGVLGLTYVIFRLGKEVCCAYWVWTLRPIILGLVGVISGSRVVLLDAEDEMSEKEGWVQLP